MKKTCRSHRKITREASGFNINRDWLLRAVCNGDSTLGVQCYPQIGYKGKTLKHGAANVLLNSPDLPDTVSIVVWGQHAVEIL